MVAAEGENANDNSHYFIRNQFCPSFGPDTKSISRTTAEGNGTPQAHVKADKDAFDRINANDYVAINAGGGTSTQQELIKFNAGFRQVVFASHSSTVMTVRPFSDTAIVTGTYTFKYKKPARGDDSGEYRYTTVYALRTGNWQIVVEQFTRVKK